MPDIQPDNKRIFNFFDGFSNIAEDPFEIEFRIQEAEELEDMKIINEWLSRIRDDKGDILSSADENDWKLYRKACHRLIPIYRKGFNLKPFDGSSEEGQKGLTGEEVLDLYANFLIWRNDLKKNTE